jgi:hypothetical protein
LPDIDVARAGQFHAGLSPSLFVRLVRLRKQNAGLQPKNTEVPKTVINLLDRLRAVWYTRPPIVKTVILANTQPCRE